MPAHEYVNGMQFHHETIHEELGYSIPVHQVTAYTGMHPLGKMIWSRKAILNIQTEPGQERRGVATALWHEGHRLAGEKGRVPKPKHSTERTDRGDAWARSVGGKLPRRSR